MAVITKFFVVRDGVEIDQVFLVKKDAETFDIMLDAADELAEFIKKGELECTLDDESIKAISVFLAKNGPEVTRILKTVKPLPPPTPKEEIPESKKTPEEIRGDREAPKPRGKKDK